ncbi:MAG: bifunctional serine/threonine-protein kinase/formylglycine-generating enzyme family protein [Tepidisphaeraceae bacterium]
MSRANFPHDSATADMQASAGTGRHSDIIAKIISELVERRARGEQISNEQVIASHPELMPDLREELVAVGEIHKAVILGQGQGTSDSPIDSSNELVLAQRKAPETAFEATDPHKGLRLEGYLIEREISSGGQATVFKALQERTGRTVAVKLMHGGPFMGSRSRTRFERESTILACLNHPNVVTILDRGRTADGSFFLVMDFIDGPNLDCFVRELGKDTAAIVHLFVKIATAIGDAHRQGIVHRDLKPMNILVDSRGEPHILDFGMARLLRDDEGSERDINPRDITRTGQVLGTLPWASPEQVSASGDAIDARSDVYALGVMLFASLAGQFPYPVDGDLRSITHHIANTPPASMTRLARRYGKRVPRSLESVVLKALCKSPSGRYESAGPLARDLEAWLAGKPRSLRQFALRKVRFVVMLGLLAGFSLVSFDQHPAIISRPSFVNSIGMRFVRVPPGGMPLPVLANEHNEIDHHQLAASLGDGEFYISATLVTQVQFLRVTGRNPSHPSKPDFPVQCVTWNDAMEFCNALSRREQRRYRLPTAAEWKFAWDLGGSSTLDQTTLDAAAWYAGNSGHHLHPVAQKIPDRLGLYDMVGDVRQWCSFSDLRSSNSTTRIEATGKYAQRVEGADYMAPASACLSPSELEREYPPATSTPFIGFRVVCESSSPN